jgi:hypothetical protein
MQLTLLIVHAESSLDLLSDGLHLDDWWNGRSSEAETKGLSVAGADGVARQDLCTCGIGVCIGFLRTQMSLSEKL